MSELPELTYIEDGCFKWTFDAKKVKRFVEVNCSGRTLNLFAGKNRLSIFYELRVDISDEFSPDIVMNAEEYLNMASQKCKFDTIIYDPPWNERKAKEKYNGKYIGKFTKLKDGIVLLLNPEGVIISLGYEITNFGISRGMELIKLAVVNPKGETRPYFVSIERKITTLDKFITKKGEN